MKLCIILSLLMVSQFAHAIMYSVGSYVPYFNRVQTSNSGATQTFEINPYFGIGGQYSLSGPHYFMPELGYSYFLNTGENVRKDTLFLHYNFSYVITNTFIARYGITNHWYRIMGQGGSVNLSNGNSKTRFPSPDKTVISHFNTLNAGLEYFISNKKYSVRFDFETMNTGDLDNRAYNYLLTVNFYR